MQMKNNLLVRKAKLYHWVWSINMLSSVSLHLRSAALQCSLGCKYLSSTTEVPNRAVKIWVNGPNNTDSTQNSNVSPSIKSLQVWDGTWGIWVAMNLRWSAWILKTIHHHISAPGWHEGSMQNGAMQSPRPMGEVSTCPRNALVQNQLFPMWNELFDSATSH